MTKNVSSFIPFIFGCSGPTLTPEEKFFFKASQPLGFILFKRNIETPEQVQTLISDLKATLTHDKACVLIDQEGGRVERLQPPHWPHRPSLRELAQSENPEQAIYDHYAAIAQDLKALGINVNCAPMLDLDSEGAHQGVMGDRTLSSDPNHVVALGTIAIKAHLDQGITPVIKHIPGHGAALYDSHEQLPTIDLTLEELESHFIPFRATAHMGSWGMTAHCLYSTLDPTCPLTQSPTGIRFVRENIGFKGLLLTDDICMKALGGSFADRAQKSLEAGCDIVLHCSGNMAEMEEIIKDIAHA